MLIIPSLDEVANTWVSSFQFEPIDEATKKLIKERVVPFNDVTMLQEDFKTCFLMFGHFTC
jgi:hypothetical protein